MRAPDEPAPAQVFHPLTGEELVDERDMALALRDTDQHIAREQAKLYRELNPVIDAAKLLRERVKYRLPAARYRTDTQAKVARCPRCGTRLE